MDAQLSLPTAPTTRPRTALTWEKVLGAIGDGKALPVVLARLQTLQNKGCEGRVQPVPAASLDKAGLTWEPGGDPLVAVRDFLVSREAREAVCCALTYAEDWLHYEWPKRTAERERTAKVRRQLENELDGGR
jgi:hypothetical protein